MSFFNLPHELQTYIYRFDSTYHSILNGVFHEIKCLNAHRYFYYNKGKLCCFYITPKNIETFLEKYFSFFSEEKKNLVKEYLNHHYNLKQVNLLENDSWEIYYDIENQYSFQKPITKINTIWSNINDIIFLS